MTSLASRHEEGIWPDLLLEEIHVRKIGFDRIGGPDRIFFRGTPGRRRRPGLPASSAARAIEPLKPERQIRVKTTPKAIARQARNRRYWNERLQFPGMKAFPSHGLSPSMHSTML